MSGTAVVYTLALAMAAHLFLDERAQLPTRQRHVTLGKPWLKAIE